MTPRPETAFKLVDSHEWSAVRDGGYAGSTVDRADGYIHMSSAAQLAETARRHYSGQTDLVLLTVDLTGFGDTLKWEPSRGGDLFPHLYAPLPASAIRSTRPLMVDDDGVMRFADGAGL